ncbi:hypothetical protein [Nocardia abscessus]|uniref:hypothetical protein n=1 Tax=Nocardia abscessus TaxID=120957 RepID=UPI002458FE66|nr:hypothetical protein [Nocardia abscessus]
MWVLLQGVTQVLRETLASTPAAHGFDKVAERGIFPEQFAEFGTDSVGHPIILGEELGDSEAVVLSVFRSRFGVPRCHGEGYGKVFGQYMRSRCGIHVSSDKRNQPPRWSDRGARPGVRNVRRSLMQPPCAVRCRS